MNGIGKRIETLRTKNSLSQAELGRKVGCSSTTIGRFEAEKTFPTSDIVADMSSIFDVSCDWLILGLGSTNSSITPDDLAFINMYHSIDKSAQLEVLHFLEFQLSKKSTNIDQMPLP